MENDRTKQCPVSLATLPMGDPVNYGPYDTLRGVVDKLQWSSPERKAEFFGIQTEGPPMVSHVFIHIENCLTQPEIYFSRKYRPFKDVE